MDPDRPAPEQPEEELPRGIGVVEITLTVVILVLLAGAGVYYFLGSGNAAVGQAAFSDPAKVEQKLDASFRKFLFTKYVGDAKACIIAPVGGQDVSFALRKSQGVLTVRRAGAFGCDGAAGEDFIIRYVDAEQFAKHITDPNCANFLSGGRGNPFWYLPSTLWPEGASAQTCNADFREKYCPALYFCIEPSSAPGGVFSCCGYDQLSPFQARRANEARKMRAHGA